jgi:hypothetical protein
VPERYVKVDLTKEECEAVHEVCDLANVMLQDLPIKASTKQHLQLQLNKVRYKMGAAATLFGAHTNIITGDAVNALSLDLAKRNKPGH